MKTKLNIILASLFFINNLASAQGIIWERTDTWKRIPVRATSHEIVRILKIDYNVTCSWDQSSAPSGMKGEVIFGDRKIRLDLFWFKNSAEIVLTGNDTPSALVHVIDNGYCNLAENSLHTTIEEVDVSNAAIGEISSRGPTRNQKRLLALKFAPFIGIRDNQAYFRDNDIPLLNAFSVRKINTETYELIYTTFFTDEDSKISRAETNEQMTRYGRRTDIEWVYKLQFDRRNLDIISGSEEYQGFLHFTRSFSGSHLPNSYQPVLYNNFDNNVFTDSPTRTHEGYGATIGHHLVPREEVRYPVAREDIMFRPGYLWLAQASDLELIRERKLSHLSTEYLYILVDGRLDRGSFVFNINGRSPEGTIDRLGEDLYQRQSYSGLYTGSRFLNNLGSSFHGTVRLRSTGRNTELQLNDLRFFRIRYTGRYQYSVEEVTSFFTCTIDSSNALSSSCRF